MKNNLHIFFLTIIFAGVLTPAAAQNFLLSRYIMVTDTVEDDGVVFAASSDDAEQINNEIDGLYDDDLDAGWEGAPEDQNILTTGLRFRNITIPSGAVIDSAFIVLHSHEGKDAADIAKITITGEATDNAATFTESDILTNRPQTNANLLWEVTEPWEIWLPYRTPDVKNIIQEIIDRNGWDSGNSIAVFLKGENQGLSDFENAREFESFENISDPEDGGDGQNHPERIPELLIYYSVSGARFEATVMMTDTIEDDGVVFEASSDDAEQINNEIDGLYDDDLDAGWEGAPEDQNVLTVGIRFRNVTIPPGAVIDSAFIQVWSHEGKNPEDVARITIYGEANDNPETYTETALISDRPKTSAFQPWEVNQAWEIWEMYQTPDLKNIIKETIGRSGWASGNAMAFMLLGENQGLSDFENAREFESFENIADPEDGGDGQNHPERRPRLVIYYSSPSASSVFTPSGLLAQSLKIAPNPSRPGIVMIELNNDSPASINIFNNNGQWVSGMASTNGNKIAFNTSRLVAGSYFVQAVQDGILYVQQLIISE